MGIYAKRHNGPAPDVLIAGTVMDNNGRTPAGRAHHLTREDRELATLCARVGRIVPERAQSNPPPHNQSRPRPRASTRRRARSPGQSVRDQDAISIPRAMASSISAAASGASGGQYCSTDARIRRSCSSVVRRSRHTTPPPAQWTRTGCRRSSARANRASSLSASSNSHQSARWVDASSSGNSPEESPGRAFLRLGNGCAAIGVVDRHVAAIHLDDVVNQQHPEDAEDLNGRACVVLQHQRGQCDVPGMLSARLGPRTVEESVQALDAGEPVCGHQE
jgi:hypothetical protein